MVSAAMGFEEGRLALGQLCRVIRDQGDLSVFRVGCLSMENINDAEILERLADILFWCSAVGVIGFHICRESESFRILLSLGET